MSEDAPVNSGAASWPDLYSAGIAVRRMQTKLHLWAARDPGRCFDDLFNLVYDPAFLVVAWERVSTNKGAGTRVSIRSLRPVSRPGRRWLGCWAMSGRN
jgi:RNA-directed DNA polymerase